MAKGQRFNLLEYLVDGRRMIAAYLSEAFRSGDVRLIAKAIGALARALIAQVNPPIAAHRLHLQIGPQGVGRALADADSALYCNFEILGRGSSSIGDFLVFDGLTLI